MRDAHLGLVGPRNRRRAKALATTLTLVAGLLLLGSAQAQASAGVCAPAEGPTVVQEALAVAGQTTGLPVALDETEIRWVRWNTRVVYGDSAVLAGQVVTQDGALANATVDLLAREAGSQDWEAVGSATTDPDNGVFSFTCLRPTRTTEYLAVYHGTFLYGPSEGARTIAVARRVPDSMTQVATDRFRFSGTVEPRYAGRPVLLQRRSCSGCGWDTLSRTDTSSTSGWRFSIDVSGFTGDRWFRAVVPGDASYVRSYSARTWRLTHH